MNQESILVVDDEEVMRDVLGSLLKQAGYEVSLASNGADGLDLARKGSYAAVLVDMMLPEMDGMTVLEELKKTDPELVVLMITAHASVETAIAAMRRGAFDYVAKPFKHEELLHALANGLNQRRLADENRQLRSALRDQGRFMEIVGKSPRMLQIFPPSRVSLSRRVREMGRPFSSAPVLMAKAAARPEMPPPATTILMAVTFLPLSTVGCQPRQACLAPRCRMNDSYRLGEKMSILFPGSSERDGRREAVSASLQWDGWRRLEKTILRRP